MRPRSEGERRIGGQWYELVAAADFAELGGGAGFLVHEDGLARGVDEGIGVDRFDAVDRELREPLRPFWVLSS